MQNNPIFSIFTGTFNSEGIISRVFQSVISQTFKNFEWIIIDDCSSDGTVGLVKDFANEYPEIEINLIIHSENTGVARSRMEALEVARGKYFITWDHDDEQSSNQLSTFHDIWNRFDDCSVGNVFSKVKDQSGKLLGIKFPVDPYLSDYISVHNKYLTGSREKNNIVEHHVCSKTEKYIEVLKHYDSNPKLLEGNSPNGGDIWSMMAFLGYNTIFINHTLRTYYTYQTDRQSMSDVKRNYNPHRVLMFKLLWVNYYDQKLGIVDIKWKIRNILATMMYGFMAGEGLSELLGRIEIPWKKLLALALSPAAALLANKYSKQ